MYDLHTIYVDREECESRDQKNVNFTRVVCSQAYTDQLKFIGILIKPCLFNHMTV